MIEMWTYFAIAFLFGSIPSTGRTFLDPEAEMYPTPCRDLTDLELSRKRHTPQGKAADYSLSGESICVQNIFKYGQRESYVEFVASHAASKTKAVGQSLVELFGQAENKASLKNIPIVIDVSAVSNPEMRPYLKSVFTETVISSLGPGTVVRNSQKIKKFRVLRVALRKVNDPATLFDIKISKPYQKGDQKTKWLEL